METTTQTANSGPEKPFASQSTIYFGSPDNRRHFRQNSPTGGIYIECWISGRDFAHIMTTVELGTREKLKGWMETNKLVSSSQETFESYFFQLCREVETKRQLKSWERQKRANHGFTPSVGLKNG